MEEDMNAVPKVESKELASYILKFLCAVYTSSYKQNALLLLQYISANGKKGITDITISTVAKVINGGGYNTHKLRELLFHYYIYKQSSDISRFISTLCSKRYEYGLVVFDDCDVIIKRICKKLFEKDRVE